MVPRVLQLREEFSEYLAILYVVFFHTLFEFFKAGGPHILIKVLQLDHIMLGWEQGFQSLNLYYYILRNHETQLLLGIRTLQSCIFLYHLVNSEQKSAVVNLRQDISFIRIPIFQILLLVWRGLIWLLYLHLLLLGWSSRGRRRILCITLLLLLRSLHYIVDFCIFTLICGHRLKEY